MFVVCISNERMDLLREYDFDCLPLIDREFDDPAVQSVVHSLIASEMRSFPPGDYLSYLPYPELTFANSTALQAEMQRLETAPSSSSHKLNLDRYNADKPEDEKSEQAWRNAVENVKAQLAQQENRLMNAELAETHLGSVWLQQNAAVEQMTKKLTVETDAINRQIREINKARQGMQTRAFPELSKLLHKKQLSFQRKWQCQVAYAQLRDQLLAQGVGAEAIIAERKAQAAMEIDENDAAHNSTVREYEAVNSSADGGSGAAAAVEEETEGPSKKHRRE